MQLHIEVVVGAGRERQRVATIKRGAELDSGEGIGLTLEEVKDLVQRLQAIAAAEQAREVEAAHASCAECGRALPRKGAASIVYRAAFGKLKLSCSRL